MRRLSLNEKALSSYLRLRALPGRLISVYRFERRILAASTGCGMLMALGAGTALANNGKLSTLATSTGSGCTSVAAGQLQSFISSAADFAIGIGASGALLMLAVGALFIIFGHTPERVSRGMKIIKNAVIGVGILAVGFFIKFVVVRPGAGRH